MAAKKCPIKFDKIKKTNRIECIYHLTRIKCSDLKRGEINSMKKMKI